ncbi:hypothetical protein HK097_006545, partial [Rhizophlyctis rosea]
VGLFGDFAENGSDPGLNPGPDEGGGGAVDFAGSDVDDMYEDDSDYEDDVEGSGAISTISRGTKRKRGASSERDGSLEPLDDNYPTSFDTLLRYIASRGAGPDDKGVNSRSYPEAVLKKLNEVLQQIVAITPHNNAKYALHKLVTDVTPRNEMDAKRFKEVLTYEKYAKRLGYEIEHPDSAMVEAHLTGSMRNHLKPLTGRNEGPGKRQKKPEKDHRVLLVPDVCKVLPFPMEILRLGFILPAVLHKLSNLSLVDEYRVEMSIPNVTTDTLYSAFSAPSAYESSNYERLETLGDSFLKFAVSWDLFKRFPNASEGWLSTKRGRIVSNRNLYKKAAEQGYGELMIVMPFIPRVWAPPGSLPWSPNKKDEDEGGEEAESVRKLQSGKGVMWRKISRKMLADFMEAVVGAYYIDGGHKACVRVLVKMG